jgi:maleylpyruvate isomerase
MLELCWKGAKEIPLKKSPNNAVRKFLKDGDTCLMEGYAEKDGVKVGFGTIFNKVVPAGTVPTPTKKVTSSGCGYSNFKLYSYWRSTASWRVRIALALKGVQYEYEAANLATLVGNTSASLPELGAVNSAEQVPVLTFTGPDGASHTLTQSMAILDFLDSIFPECPLLPKDPLAKARCMQIAEVVNSGVHPGQNLSVLRQVKQAEVVGSGDVVDGKGLAKAHLEKGLAHLEALVAASARENSFAGGTEFPSLADLFIIPQLYNAGRFGIDMAAYPSLVAMEMMCSGLEAFKVARPETQPDAPSS